MPTITLTLPVAGNQITAGLHATNYSALQALLNGGLDQSNISTAATPTMASLTLTGIAGLVLSGNGGKDTLNLSNTTADVGMTIGGDVTLYRGAANSLRTDDTFRIVRSVAGDNSLETLVSGDAQLRHYITAGGDHWWGGGATTADTNLYRSAADTLKTDDLLDIDRPLTTDYAFRVRTAGEANARLRITAGGVLDFGPGGGSAGDTNLYRGAANQLQTDDSFYLIGASYIANKAVSTDANVRYYIDPSGSINWGAGGASAVDTNLYRSAPNVLRTDDQFDAAGGLKASAGHVEVSTGNVYLYGAATGLILGSTSDVNLYRGGANILQTDDYFTVGNVAAPANATGIAAYVGGIGLRDLYVGAADSAGVGYRQVRVAN